MNSGNLQTDLPNVARAFSESFGQHPAPVDNELGAALCVIQHGRVLLDVQGGFTDETGARAWAPDTLAPIMSATKAFAALCIHHLAQQEKLDLAAPITHYWPRFSMHGKGSITLQHVLEHRAGLSVVDASQRNLGFDSSAWRQALESAYPQSAAGEIAAYHAVTYGYLLGEVVERVTGLTIGHYWRQYFADAIGCSAYIGIGVAEEARAASWCPLPEHDVNRLIALNPQSDAVLPIIQLMQPVDFNTPEFRHAEIASANGYASARGLAQLYAAVGACLDDSHSALLTRRSLLQAIAPRWEGVERRTGRHWRMASGLMLSTDFAQMGPGTRSFGHPGSGGACGFFDPDSGLAVGYVLNRPCPGGGTGARFARLVEALYRDLLGRFI